jgi:hypothetical protein
MQAAGYGGSLGGSCLWRDVRVGAQGLLYAPAHDERAHARPSVDSSVDEGANFDEESQTSTTGQDRNRAAGGSVGPVKARPQWS